MERKRMASWLSHGTSVSHENEPGQRRPSPSPDARRIDVVSRDSSTRPAAFEHHLTLAVSRYAPLHSCKPLHRRNWELGTRIEESFPFFRRFDSFDILGVWNFFCWKKRSRRWMIFERRFSFLVRDISFNFFNIGYILFIF